MPNPWDVGSARLLESLGFEALATTSAGFAWSLGRLDQTVTRDELVAHVAAIAAATTVPLNVDSERCYPGRPRRRRRDRVVARRSRRRRLLDRGLRPGDGHDRRRRGRGRARSDRSRCRARAARAARAHRPGREPHPRRRRPRRHDRAPARLSRRRCRRGLRAGPRRPRADPGGRRGGRRARERPRPAGRAVRAELAVGRRATRLDRRPASPARPTRRCVAGARELQTEGTVARRGGVPRETLRDAFS